MYDVLVAGLWRGVRRQAARRVPVRGRHRRQGRTLGGLDCAAGGGGRRCRRRRLLARGGREARVPPALVRWLVRRARHHPRRERQVVPGVGRCRGARLLRRPRRRPLCLAALLPRAPAQDDEPVRAQVGEVPANGRSLVATLRARVQHAARHRARNGARERGRGARGVLRQRAMRAAGCARPRRRPRHTLPRATRARPRLGLRRRGARHRLGLGAEPIVALGTRPARRRVARRLGLVSRRGQLRAAAGAHELVHGARVRARAPATLSACDTPPARGAS